MRIVGVVLLLTSACSFDGLDGYSNGDASTNGDASGDVTPPVSCSTSATRCMPAAPAGFTGPFSFSDTPVGTPVPGCPAPLGQVVNAHVNYASSLSCSHCTCSVSSPTCAIANGTFYALGGCGGTSAKFGSGNNNCGMTGNITVDSASFPEPAGQATCSPSGGALQGSPAAWGDNAVGCQAPAAALVPADCPTGDVCAPVSPSGFEAPLCVETVGDTPCPSAYPTKRVVYGALSDPRACPQCPCTASSTTKCTGTVAIYADSSCGSPLTSFTMGTCQTSGGSFATQSMKVLDTPPPLNTFSCATQDVVPTGNVVTSNATTICCAVN